MTPFHNLRATIRQHEQLIYTILCIGIVYSFIFWTLLNSILCLSLAGIWLLFTEKKRAPYAPFKGKIILFAALYLLLLLGMLNTTNIEEGIFRLQQKAPLLLFPIIFGTTSILDGKSIHKILLHTVIATTIACLAGIGYGLYKTAFTGDLNMLTGINLLVMEDMYPYTLGLCCLLSIFILFHFSIRGLYNKPLLLGAGLILSASIILLSTRLIIACWALSLLYFTWRKLPRLSYKVATAAFVLATMIIGAIFIPSLNRQWKELIDLTPSNTIHLDQDASLGRSWGGKAIRFAIWQCSKDVLQENWVLGVGTGDVQSKLQEAYEKRQFYFASRYNRYNAHNQYLQSFLTNGILALLSLLACIIVPLVTLQRNNDLTLIYGLFLLLFAAICFSESILETNKGVLWYSFFNSIFAFYRPTTK